MVTLKDLQEQKAMLDRQIADALRQAKIQQIALDLKMEEQRKTESVQAILEIKNLINRYNLSRFDIFEDLKRQLSTKMSRQVMLHAIVPLPALVSGSAKPRLAISSSA